LGDPTLWAPHYGDNWDKNISEVDAKHVDCDGNGRIDTNDLEAVRRNYQPERLWQSLVTPGAPPVFFSFQESFIENNSGEGGTIAIAADVYLGSEATPVEDWHGIAFNLHYDHDFIQPNSFQVEYDSSSFFGPPDSTLLFHYIVEESQPGRGRLDLALTRLGNASVNGHGKVATVRFVVISDIIIGLVQRETPIRMVMERIRVLGPDGEPRPYDLPFGTAEATIVQDLTSRNPPKEWESKIRVFPNPAKDHLRIDLDRTEGYLYELIDLDGRRRLHGTINSSNIVIPISGLSAGNYFLRIHTDKGILVGKVLVE
jgi:hypothetical protein